MNQEKNIRTPNTKSEWEKYFDLRYRLLRKPWGKPVGSEKDKIEKECTHAAYFKNDKILIHTSYVIPNISKLLHIIAFCFFMTTNSFTITEKLLISVPCNH